jgi:hypothetical protein
VIILMMIAEDGMNRNVRGISVTTSVLIMKMSDHPGLLAGGSQAAGMSAAGVDGAVAWAGLQQRHHRSQRHTAARRQLGRRAGRAEELDACDHRDSSAE